MPTNCSYRPSPIQGTDESNEDYEERIRKDYYDMSSISGIFKSFGDSERGFKGEMEEIQWGIGAEYTYNDKFILRAGYHHESAMQGNRKYATVGAGFRMNVLSIDAGYVIATQPTNPARPDAARFPRLRFRRHTRPPRQTPLKPRLNTHSLTSHTPKTL